MPVARVDSASSPRRPGACEASVSLARGGGATSDRCWLPLDQNVRPVESARTSPSLHHPSKYGCNRGRSRRKVSLAARSTRSCWCWSLRYPFSDRVPNHVKEPRMHYRFAQPLEVKRANRWKLVEQGREALERHECQWTEGRSIPPKLDSAHRALQIALSHRLYLNVAGKRRN